MQYRRHLRDHSLTDFESRCCEKLETLGDIAIDARQHDDAISQYSAALSLNPTTPQALFAQALFAQALFVQQRRAAGMWEDALSDANGVCHFYCTQLCRC
jgi:tetratricopeptide (TPR) repeat protein